MRISVLVDNNTSMGNTLTPEHGLSFYIEEAGKKLVFDCGTTDAFIKNAYKMGVDLEHVTDIILSHSHSDHVGGFLKLQLLYQKLKSIGLDVGQKNIFSHPDVFMENTIDGLFGDEDNIHFNKDTLDSFFNLVLAKEPQEISDKLYYLGSIPIEKAVKLDYTPDETALAYKSEEGLIIISGCSHSGVENIIEHARKVTGEQKVKTLIGGIYLINRSGEEVNELGKYLSSQGIEKIYPCHCTDLESRIILSRYVKIGEVSVGRAFSCN